MLIQGKKILILGGWGLVGSAICHKLMEHNPSQLIILSLNKDEAEDSVKMLKKDYPNSPDDMFIAKWGNIFFRDEWKDKSWKELMLEPEKRQAIITDVFNELDKDILTKSSLYKLLIDTKPDIVIDCINTATAIAYLDIYTGAKQVQKALSEGNLENILVEKLMSTMYIPQLIRHIQILFRGLTDAGSKLYLKIGTSGTGGMGLNIPYTHSEERPSRVLLSKTAVAGAQTLLLFLMARTPNAPIVKEIKPTAAIAWKKIQYGKVRRKGNFIPLIDLPPNNAFQIDEPFDLSKNDYIIELGKDLESVFIDTGENGIFSKGEFQAIATLGQMEIVTPEEIAEYAIFEILGGNTGRDVISALDSSTLGPTYRGGFLFNTAIEKIKSIEKKYDVESVAFEMLGPPRLSKLLFEAYILKQIAGSINEVLEYDPKDLANESAKIVNTDIKLRSEMLSIGLVVLMPNGKNYLRGKSVIIPSGISNPIKITDELLEKWCYEGWIDLRPKNFTDWQKRFKRIIEQANSIDENDTSSRYAFTRDYWENFNSIDHGKLAAWIFQFEDNGWRFKR